MPRILVIRDSSIPTARRISSQTNTLRCCGTDSLERKRREMMATPITVLIPCKDEMPNIEACIASFKDVADEILVADSGSTDGTLELLRRRGDVRIIERDYRCWSDFNNWAIPQAKHEWVLLVDADERVSPELAEDIRRLKSTELATTSFDAFSMVRRNYFHAQAVRSWGRHSDSVKRLFRRSCRWAKRRTHSTLEVSDSKTEFLKTAFDHHTFRTMKHFLDKQQRYGQWNAEELWDRGQRATAWHLVCRPVIRFMRDYFMRGGFLDGKVGLIIACTAAYTVFVKFATLWEKELQAEATPDVVKFPSVTSSATSSPNESRKAA